MCTLLKVANRKPVNLISPFFVHEEQITSVGSTGDNSAALACFSCTVHVFSTLSAFSTFWHFHRPCRAASALVLIRNATQHIRNVLWTRTAPAADYLPTSNHTPTNAVMKLNMAPTILKNTINWLHGLL